MLGALRAAPVVASNEVQSACVGQVVMAPLELGVIRYRPPVPAVKFFGQRCRNVKAGYNSVGRRSQRQTHLAMNLLLLLALAVPLSCVAFLSLLVLLGIMTLGAVIHVLGTVRACWPHWRGVEQATNPAG